MLALLNWRLWLLVGLLALGPIGYLKGRGDGKELVRAEWLSAKAQADAEARSLEQRRQRRADEAANLTAAARRDDRDRAASADRRIAGMRGTLDATERNAAQSL